MKIYVSMNALPWEEFVVTAPDPRDASQNIQVKASSNASRAGFIPLFWSAEEAEATFPGLPVQEVEVSDDWNPWLNASKAAAPEAPAVEADA